MRSISGVLFCIAAALFTMAALLAEQTYGQQADGVFIGRGRIARQGASNERRPYTDDDLKPMARGRFFEEIESLEQQCLDAVNRQREAKGLAPLELSDDLLEVARYYSQRMAEEQFFSHTDPQGRTVRQRVSEAGIRWRMLGENLAYSNGYTNPVAASMHGWMESPTHRRNILDPSFQKTAIGTWISPNGTVYFTEIFLRQ